MNKINVFEGTFANIDDFKLILSKERADELECLAAVYEVPLGKMLGALCSGYIMSIPYKSLDVSMRSVGYFLEDFE